MADNYWVPMRLPSPKEIAKYALWGTGRVILSGWLFGLYGVTVVCKVTIKPIRNSQFAIRNYVL